jgi:hypothetical protein
MIKWVKGRKGIWFKKPIAVAWLLHFWFDYSILIYKFYADFAMGKISTQAVDKAAISLVRKRMRVPNFVSNETLREILQIKPSYIVEKRLFKEGRSSENPSEPNWLLSLKWYRALKLVSISQLWSAWRKYHYDISKICGKHLSKQCMKGHPSYRIWAKWFLGKTLLGALANMENLTADEISDIVEKVNQMRKANRIYHTPLSGSKSSRGSSPSEEDELPLTNPLTKHNNIILKGH